MISVNLWLSLKIEWNQELELLTMLIEARNRLDIMCYKEVLIAGYYTSVTLASMNRAKHSLVEGMQSSLEHL